MPVDSCTTIAFPIPQGEAENHGARGFLIDKTSFSLSITMIEEREPMKNVFSNTVYALLTGFILMHSANAATVTHGDLTSDDTTSIITDTVLGRDYLRLDEYDMTYAQTLAAVGAGGVYEGWTIATWAEAQDFRNATGSNMTGWSDGDFGDSNNGSHDYYLYLSGSDLGLGLINDNGSHTGINNWRSSHTGGDGNSDANFLLYRASAAVVPVPAAVWLLGSALGGLGFMRRRKAS